MPSSTSTPSRWLANESCAQRLQHLPEGCSIHPSADPEPFARCQHQFQSCVIRSSSPLLCLHQGETHRRRCLQPLPPIVEGLLGEALLFAELFYRHPASLLCRDPRAPILVSCLQLPCHSRFCHGSTMRLRERRWKTGLSDVYPMMQFNALSKNA